MFQCSMENGVTVVETGADHRTCHKEHSSNISMDRQLPDGDSSSFNVRDLGITHKYETSVIRAWDGRLLHNR